MCAARLSSFVPAIAIAALLVLATSAHAQDASTSIELVVVTGTRLPQSGLASVSPVLELDLSDIKLSGTLRVEDAINQLPQAFADQSATVNDHATGTATVNLRDLGPERTLVLIDGKRLMPGDPTSGWVAPDLNIIPEALVDHIDVVTGGASAVYGSDAIAGVVNFIMKRDFTGIEVDLQGGVYNHDNGETAIHKAVAAQGDTPAPSHITDGFTGDATLVVGIDTPDEKGNVTLYGGYRTTNPITQATRDFSICALMAVGTGFVCSASGASTYPGHFWVLDPATFDLVGNLTLDSNGPGDTMRPFDISRDGYNFAPGRYFQRTDTRYVAGAFAHYALLPTMEAYADTMFMTDRTTARVAPSGLFADTLYSISCTNPMLSTDEVQNFCTDAGVPPGGDALIAVGRRNVEGGGRESQFTHIDYRVVGGIRGDIGGWHYDVSAQYAAVALDNEVLHDVSLMRVADALDVVQAGSGNLVCASGDPGCVPYDIFKIGGVTKAALAYVDASAKATGGTDETVVSATLAGDVDELKMPWASDSVAVALGAEYRREGLDFSPGPELASGDLSGYGTATPPVRGAFDVAELYGEMRLPLVEHGGLLLEDISVEGGYRHSWYSNASEVTTYKAGAEWMPIQGLTFRSSFNHAVRAPNVDELFTPQIETQFDLFNDPCAGPDPVATNPVATAVNCARTGVSAAQYGNIIASPTDGYNTLDGGNPKLRPESADTVTFGAVIAAHSHGDINLAVDYFHIRILGVIRQIDPEFTLEQCLQTGEPVFCDLIHRAAGTGSLWITPAGYVSNLFENAASLETQGVDIDLNYRHALPVWNRQNLGAIRIRLIGTYLMSLRNVDATGTPPYDCAGYYGYGNTTGCADPAPRWRHTLRTTWSTPWHFDVALSWRYISATRVAASSSNPVLANSFEPADLRLGSRSYFDLSFDWQMSDHFEARLAVNNLFDTDPPVAGTSASDFLYGVAANGNTYPGVYDALGRWLFVGLTARN